MFKINVFDGRPIDNNLEYIMTETYSNIEDFEITDIFTGETLKNEFNEDGYLVQISYGGFTTYQLVNEGI